MRSLVGGALLVFVLFAGCGTKKMVRLEGEVIKITGTLPALVQSAGAFFGNESVKWSDASLVYMVQTTDGSIHTLNIVERRQVPRATLLARVCLGTKVSFTAKLVNAAADGSEKNDPNYHVGSVYSNDILVPVPCIK